MIKLTTKSVINVIKVLIAGETDVDKLVQLVYGNTKNKQNGKLKEALSGNVKEHHRQFLEWSMQLYVLYEKKALNNWLAWKKYVVNIIL